MHRLLIAFLLMLNVTLSYCVTSRDSLLRQLEENITQRDEFFHLKTEHIQSYTNQLAKIRKSNYRAQYALSLKLYYEYESFVYDSAYKYIERAGKAAFLMNNPTLAAYAKIRTGFVLLSSGLFKESLDTLKSIPIANFNDTIKREYYIVYARTYYDLADYDRDTPFASIYTKLGNQLMDSAMHYTAKESSDFLALEGLLKMKQDNFPAAIAAYELWMHQFKMSDHQYAIAASSLGYVYSLLNRNDKAIDLLIGASIADIRSSTRETVALRNLSDLLFKEGDVKTAYRYIKIAMEDATFYNARHRKIEIAKILPIIEGEKLNTVEKQKTILIFYAVMLTVLILMVLVFAWVIFKQLKKLKQAKQIIQEINTNLMETNNKMMEANRIKEEYIGYFFNISSEYIEKMVTFEKTIYRKVVARQFDDLSNIIKNSDLKREKENLFLNFDKIFIKLFPNFVNDFNLLFKEEDRVQLKGDELLTPELRIFALMRLGIKDNEKIAKFLDYSVNTIYTYKTKIKSKSIHRERFEERIMEIKTHW